MDIGVGLPAAIPGVDGATVVAWARRADELGFASLGIIDRLVYDNFDPLIALAAAAAVTEKARLITGVLLAPLRNTAVLAKETATLDRLSGGRLVLGIGIGGRPDDFELAEVDIHTRGVRMSRQLEQLKATWAGETGIGPKPSRPGGPMILMGGGDARALARGAQYADGWIGGGGGPERFVQGAAAFGEAWKAAGRSGKPRLAGVSYYALGVERDEAIASVLHYYGAFGQFIAPGVPTTAEAVQGVVAAYAAAGCDELVLLPLIADGAQLERLAETVQR